MINKQYSPKGRSVRVTFELPADSVSESVIVLGDFNGWEANDDGMKFDNKKGVWSKTISLKPGRSYQFRYLIDGAKWHNDPHADAYEPNPYYSENSVLHV